MKENKKLCIKVNPELNVIIEKLCKSSLGGVHKLRLQDEVGRWLSKCQQMLTEVGRWSVLCKR